MTQALKRLFKFVPFCVAASGIAAAPAWGGERAGAQGSLSAQPVISRAITLELARDGGVSSFSHVGREPAAARPGEARLFVTAFGRSGGGKALRVDLFHFEVTRARADAAADGPAGAFPASVLRIGVTRGASPESKAVGIAMQLAPHLVLESRLGPAGASDTALQFRLRF